MRFRFTMGGGGQYRSRAHLAHQPDLCGTVVTFLYQQSFSYLDMGYGSAAAMVLLAIIFALSLVRMLVSEGRIK